MVRNFNRSRRVMQTIPFYYEKSVDNIAVEVAIQYNDSFSETVFSFANCINTEEGGSHLTGFRSALTRVINDYARKTRVHQGRPAQPDRRRRARRPGGGDQRENG